MGHEITGTMCLTFDIHTPNRRFRRSYPLPPDPTCRNPRAVCQKPMTAMTKEGSLGNKRKHRGVGPLQPSHPSLILRQ